MKYYPPFTYPFLNYGLWTWIYFFLLLPLPLAGAKVHEYETTRLKSTAGAGVASVLMDESAVLNPAPVAFFDVTSFYFQKMNADFTTEGTNTHPEVGSRYSRDNDSYGLIVADGKNQLKGAVGYQTQNEGDDHRQRFSGTMAHPVGQMSSFGALYRWTKDSSTPEEGPPLKEDYHQVILGVTHAVTPNLTFGATVADPLKGRKEDGVAVLGSQFLFENIISLMLDIGANYREDPAQTFFYKGAFQLNFFEDLYLRAGTFRDKGTNEKGNGLGLGWISPRLVVDFAIKNTRPLTETPLISSLQPYPHALLAMREISFSLSYRF